MRIPPVLLPLAALSTFFLLVAPPAAFAEEWTLDTLGTDADWWPGFAPPGFYGADPYMDELFLAGCGFGDRLVVQGGFTSVNGVDVPGLAVWDGASWASLEPPAELGTATCFAAWEGDLAVGGSEGAVWAWDGAT